MPPEFGLALWGVAGAFIYAAPRLTACVLQARAATPRGSSFLCAWEFVVCLLTGAILSGALVEGVASFLHRTSLPEMRVLSTFVGLCSNKAASVIVEAVSVRLTKVISGDNQ